MASEAGKGSKPRPIFDQERFELNYDLIFGKKKKLEDWDEKRVDIIGSNGNDGLHYKEIKEDK